MPGEDVPDLVDVLLTDAGQLAADFREPEPHPGDALPLGRDLRLHAPLPDMGGLHGHGPCAHLVQGEFGPFGGLPDLIHQAHVRLQRTLEIVALIVHVADGS